MKELIRANFGLLAAGVATFVMMGAGQSLYGPALPAFARNLDLSMAAAAWLVSAHWIGCAIGVGFMYFAGTRVVPRHVIATMALGAALVTFGPGRFGAFGGALVFGAGYGAATVVFNPRILRAFGDKGTAMLSLLNASFGIGAGSGEQHRPGESIGYSQLEGIEFERVGERELHVMLPGVWRDLGVWFTWRPDVSTLQMGAPLDLKGPASRLGDASRLITMINERLWVGHFDLWTDDNSIVFRNSVILPESGALEPGQGEALIRAASEAVDRFYPAFNFLIWGGKSPEEALEASLFETAGSA